MPKIDIITASQIESVQTIEQFEEVIEKYKIANPAKYNLKLANGEFEKFRKVLGGGKEPEKSLEENTKAELVELATTKGISLKGTETKAELVELLKTLVV